MNPQQGYTDRDWKDDFSHENGKYINICMDCKLPFYGHKRRVVCYKCAQYPTEQDQELVLIPPTEYSMLKSELSRLTEKYSQRCARCHENVQIALATGINSGLTNCHVCHGTGRVWMMGVEEIEKMQKDVEDERHEWFNRACNRILGGK